MLYVVTYTANSNDEHWADPVYHTNKFERQFEDKIDALHFFEECTSPHKDIRELDESSEETLKSFIDHEGTIIYYY